MGVLNTKLEYYHYGHKCKIVGAVNRSKDKPVLVVVNYGDTYNEALEVVHAGDLNLWEDTYQYKQEKKIVDDIERLKKDREKIVKELKEEAVSSLKMRMTLNAFFGKESSKAQQDIAVVVLSELTKLIESKKI